MNECEKYREMLSAMLDGELDAGESERLIAHLSLCAECRELYELLSSVTGSEVWELPEIPEGLHGRIMSGVKAAAAEKKKRARVVRLRPIAVAAACLAVIVGVILGVPRVFRMGGSSGAPESIFNTTAAASSNAAPAAQDNAGIDTAAPAEAADENAWPDQDAPTADSGFEGTAGSGYAYVGHGDGDTPEYAPVPEPEAAPGELKESEEPVPELDIDRSVVTVESGGKSVSEKLNRYDTLLWLRTIIEDSSGGGFDAARLEVFRRGGADYEVYFYHDGEKLMGSLAEDLQDSIELETLADFAQFEEMAGGAKGAK